MSKVSIYVWELNVEYVKWFSDIVVSKYLTSRNITIQDAVDYIGLGEIFIKENVISTSP